MQIIDLEFRLYRHEKLVEALCDIIQSHDPNFVLEEDEILQTFLNPKEGKLISQSLIVLNRGGVIKEKLS